MCKNENVSSKMIESVNPLENILSILPTSAKSKKYCACDAFFNKKQQHAKVEMCKVK